MTTILPNPIAPDTRCGLKFLNNHGNPAPHKPYNVRRALTVHRCIVPSGYLRTVTVYPSISTLFPAGQ